MDPFRQLRSALLVLFLLLIAGTLGFYYIEHLSLLDSLYMTVITFTTVGYEVVRPLSPLGKGFVIILSLTSLFVIFIVVFSAISNAIEIAASDRLQHLFWRRRMERNIRSIKDHYIICGYGRMGQSIAGEFCARDVPYVVVENNPEQIPKLIEQRALYVEGDASDEQTLRDAGVERAKGLIAVAPSDADNTFIVLTARGMNPKLFIVARNIKAQDEPKLRRAGADRVISPYILGGKRMAWAVLRPTVVDFLDSAVYSESLELEIFEIAIKEDSSFAGRTIRESNIRERTGATIVAVKNRGGTLTSSPSPDMEIRDGDILIAIGTAKQLESLQNMAES